MDVRILNPEVLEHLYENHGQFACTCYNTPEKYAERVGKSCQKDGHMSGSRCEYIKFHISGIDRGTAEQCLRHEIGVDVPFEYQDNYRFSDYMEQVIDVDPTHIVKNMASFRYIDKDGFEYETPNVINIVDEARIRYERIMQYIDFERRLLKNVLEENGVDPKAANEAANFVLPRATKTEFVIGFTPEALIRFFHKRLCTRAQEQIQDLANKMKAEVEKINPRFAKEAVPQCMHLLWCPEGKRTCHMMPTKEELEAKLELDKKWIL